jgi:ribokinase
MAKLAGGATFFTALGRDPLGDRAAERLEELGLTLHVAWRDAPQRRGFAYLDDDGERTITVIGERHAPSGEDPLPWAELADADAVYFTAGDAGALRHARDAGRLVTTPRAADTIAEAGMTLDALVHSGNDETERAAAARIRPAPELLIATQGRRGGTWTAEHGATGTFKAAELPGPLVDQYGAGDSFAGGFTYGLGAGLDVDAALELAARCGASNLTGRGPYAGQLDAAAVSR